MSFGEGVFLSVRDLFLEGKKCRFDLHLKKSSSLKIAGDKRSKVRGRGMDFFESRPYVAQDEMKNIDWKVSARLNELYSKIYTEEKDRPVFLVVDLRSSMFFGSINCFKSVLAARIAAQLGTAAINGADNVGCLIFNEQSQHESAIKRGKKSLARIFGLLAEGTKAQVAPSQSAVWESVLERANRQPAGSMIFLLSDFLGLDQSHKPLLYRLKKRGDILAIKVEDPLEKHLPEIGTVSLAYGDQEVVFDSFDQGIRKRYEAKKKKQEQGVADIFATLGIPMIEFSTAVDPSTQLKKIFMGRW